MGCRYLTMTVATASIAFLCVSMFLTHVAMASPNGTSSTEIPLRPFQLIFEAVPMAGDLNGTNTLSTNVPTATTGGKQMNTMRLLQATKYHLAHGLASMDPNFQYLLLYQAQRTQQDLMFENGTQVAFVGSAYYRTNPNCTDDDMLVAAYMCFLGQNAQDYVHLLQFLGWNGLQNVNVMTSTGQMVDYQDGQMMIMPTSTDTSGGGAGGSGTDSITAASTMGEEQKMTLYLAAVLVPSLVLAMAMAAWIAYRVRHSALGSSCRNITSTTAVATEIDPHHPVWQHGSADGRAWRRITLQQALELENHQAPALRSTSLHQVTTKSGHPNNPDPTLLATLPALSGPSPRRHPQDAPVLRAVDEDRFDVESTRVAIPRRGVRRTPAPLAAIDEL